MMKNGRAKLLVRVGLLLGTITSLFFVPWLLVKAWITPVPQTIQEELTLAIEHGFDGVVVYVDQADMPAQHFAAGWHDKNAQIPANTQALFKIASISKLYDAVAITKLAHAGQLSLESTIVDYLPTLASKIENADKITLRMMVQHRSGIPNFTDAPNFWAEPTQNFEQSIALIAGKAARFAPDEDYEYSNTNYLLLNEIMNTVLGYDNFEFIQQEILAPLKLNNTYPSINAVNLNDVMSGYHVGHPHDLKQDKHGMLATAQDVGLFIRALNNGTVFQSGEQDLYTSLYEYEHGGWVPGYQSFANYYPKIDTVVISFYSTTDSALYNWNLSEIINNRIVKILQNQTQ